MHDKSNYTPISNELYWEVKEILFNDAPNDSYLTEVLYQIDNDVHTFDKLWTTKKFLTYSTLNNVIDYLIHIKVDLLRKWHNDPYSDESILLRSTYVDKVSKDLQLLL